MSDRHWHLATASQNGQLQTHAIFLIKPEVSGEGVVLQECQSGSCYALQYISLALTAIAQAPQKRIELPNLRG